MLLVSPFGESSIGGQLGKQETRVDKEWLGQASEQNFFLPYQLRDQFRRLSQILDVT